MIQSRVDRYSLNAVRLGVQDKGTHTTKLTILLPQKKK